MTTKLSLELIALDLTVHHIFCFDFKMNEAFQHRNPPLARAAQTVTLLIKDLVDASDYYRKFDQMLRGKNE